MAETGRAPRAGAMRMSRLMGRTLRSAPADAESANHQLLARAGLIVQLSAGVYSFLAPAWRSIRRIEQIIREEMEAAEAQEIRMPAIQPLELWRESGRDRSYGPVLFRLTDRREREMVLAPTHEESVTDIFRKTVQSYRELPLRAYQFQTKFRDEPRPRGGLVRVREFIMKDAYSFDLDEESFQATYAAFARAYANVFRRCGVPVVPVQADSGAIGGKQSEEFIFLSGIGEDAIALCRACGYAANQERAEISRGEAPAEAPAEVAEEATPGIATIAALCGHLGIPATRTAKAAFFLADGRPVFAVIRGDLEVNELKLANAAGAREVRPMEPGEVAAQGWVAGSASPVGVDPALVIADPSAAEWPNLAGGANRDGFHLRNLNYGRDWTASAVADIANAREGDPCGACGGPLELRRGIELGHIFRLGEVYAEPMDAGFLTESGERALPIMGCFGIGLERLMAAVVEANHDEAGIAWPVSVAPWHVHIVAIQAGDERVSAALGELERQLGGLGISSLADDRDERPGVKFNDADLIGLPLRATIGPRGLENGVVELKARAGGESAEAPLAEAAGRIASMLAALPGAGDAPSVV